MIARCEVTDALGTIFSLDLRLATMASSSLLELIREYGAFDVQMVRLKAGDYLIDDEVLVERKTAADFAASLADGRLFPQAARLAHSPHRSLVLIEGPTMMPMPDVHPHAIQGAIVSVLPMK